jgi:hypothetical protein
MRLRRELLILGARPSRGPTVAEQRQRARTLNMRIKAAQRLALPRLSLGALVLLPMRTAALSSAAAALASARQPPP